MRAAAKKCFDFAVAKRLQLPGQREIKNSDTSEVKWLQDSGWSILEHYSQQLVMQIYENSWSVRTNLSIFFVWRITTESSLKGQNCNMYTQMQHSTAPDESAILERSAF